MLEIQLPNKKYQIIYADPPWQYENWNTKWHEQHPESRWAGKKYQLMSVSEIRSLPINEIADTNAALFLWTISTMLPDALKVIDSWGFKYKTLGFAWVKKNKVKDSFFTGMGFYTRSNVELCLLAIKGKPLPRLSHSIHQVVHTPVEKHSKKPDEVRQRIVQLFGDLPRIELFARDRPDPEWDVWGLEAPED